MPAETATQKRDKLGDIHIKLHYILWHHAQIYPAVF